MSADRVSAAGTITGVNVQLADLTWAGVSETFKAYKTLNKADLLAHTGGTQEVHAVPQNPLDGQKIELLEDVTIGGSGILLVGYAENDITWGWLGQVGSITPAPPNPIFSGVVAYGKDTALQANVRDTVTVLAASGKVLTKLIVNGNAYNLSAAGAPLTNYYIADGIHGSDLQIGKKYAIQVETASEKAYPDVVLKTGETYIWTGYQWSKEERGQTASEVTEAIKNNVPQQFRTDADTSGGYFTPSEFWGGTASSEATLTKKIGGLYFITQ